MANFDTAEQTDDIFENESGTSPGVEGDVDETIQEPKDDPTAAELAEKEAADTKTAEDEKAAEDAKTAEAAAKNPAKGAPEGYVPHEALHEARLQAQELKTSLEAANQKLGIVDSLKDQLDELRKKGETTEVADPAPNKEEDPIAFLEWENRQLARDVKALKDKGAAEEKAATEAENNSKVSQEQQEKIQLFMKDTYNQVMEYQKTTAPDYSDAFKHVQTKRMEEYAALGVTDPAAQQQMFDREVMGVAWTASQNKLNPGEAMYNLAKAQGYVKAEKPADDGKDKDKDNDKGGDKGGETLEEQMIRLQKGAGAGGMGAGSQPEGELTLADINEMTDKEFDDFWSKNITGTSIY